MTLAKLRTALLLIAGCKSTTPPPQNVAATAAHETLPCFARDLDIRAWHQLVRADHTLVFDVVSEDGPPPGWPDGWQAGSCRVIPKYNEATTMMDFLVQERGATIASVGERHVDFYVRTPLPGPQPGDRVGKHAFRECVNAYDVWKFDGNRLCGDGSNDRAFLVRTDREDPQPSDPIIARREAVGDRVGKSH